MANNRKYECLFCRSTFTTKQSLNIHKKAARYCLKNRGLLVNVKKIKCIYCNKKYSIKSNLAKHKLSCGAKNNYFLLKNTRIKNIKLKKRNVNFRTENNILKTKVIDLEKQIIELQKKLAKKEGEIDGIIKAPVRNVTNNTTNKNTNTMYVNPKLVNINVENIEPLTIERIKKQISNGKFTDEHFEKGVDGIVEFLVPIMTLKRDDGTVERNYVCTDVSRNKFYRLEEGKVWKSDSGGLFIGEAIQGLGPSVNDSYRRLVNKKHSTDSDHMKNVYKEKIDKLMPIFRASVGNFNDEFMNVLTKTKNKMKHHISV